MSSDGKGLVANVVDVPKGSGFGLRPAAETKWPQSHFVRMQSTATVPERG